VNTLPADRCDRIRQRGVGRSTGQTPDNVAAMARDAVAFIGMLGLSEVDLLGFSLGGCVAQQIAAEHGALVRRLILVGTAPQTGEEHPLGRSAGLFEDRCAGPTPAALLHVVDRQPGGRPVYAYSVGAS